MVIMMMMLNHANNISFTPKLCVACLRVTSKRQSKTIKRFRKGFERLVYWNKYKTKIETKNRVSSEQMFS